MKTDTQLYKEVNSYPPLEFILEGLKDLLYITEAVGQVYIILRYTYMKQAYSNQKHVLVLCNFSL